MTIVVAALIEREGRILICRRREDQVHAGKWEFPGGKVEAGETPADALRRELGEELGIDGVEAERLVEYEFAYPGKDPLRLVFFRVAAYRGGIDGSQFDAISWERPEELPRFDFLAGDEQIVRDLASGRYAA